MNIAIDGPSGAGKSTIAKLLAKKLNFVYLDTGAMYRAVGLKIFNLGISSDNEKEINKIIFSTDVNITYSNGEQKVLLDGIDVTGLIREHHISKYASDVSKIKSVRLKLVDLQRAISSKTDTVLDGRDIGTFVLPNAELKFFLTASLDERARRRFLELTSRGAQVELENIKKDIAERDYNDSHREFAPLKEAPDSIVIDSTSLSIDETCEVMLKIIRSKQK